MSDLTEKPKVNLDFWDLFIIISIISFLKLNFSKIFPLNVLGSKLVLGIK